MQIQLRSLLILSKSEAPEAKRRRKIPNIFIPAQRTFSQRAPTLSELAQVGISSSSSSTQSGLVNQRSLIDDKHTHKQRDRETERQNGCRKKYHPNSARAEEQYSTAALVKCVCLFVCLSQARQQAVRRELPPVSSLSGQPINPIAINRHLCTHSCNSAILHRPPIHQLSIQSHTHRRNEASK